jgi:DNA-binding CsgD family transcriptional regulator
MNPWSSIMHLMPVGEVGIGRGLLPQEEFLGTEIDNAWMKPLALLHSIRSVVYKNETEVLIAAVVRAPDQGEFTEEDRLAFKTLVPHFQRSIAGYELLNRLNLLSQSAVAVLDCLPIGVAILSRTGRPVVINRIAREILNEGDGLRLRLTGLQALLACENARLQTALKLAVEAVANGQPNGLSTVSISRPSGRHRICLSLLPLPLQNPMFSNDRPAVAVVIDDPERESETDEKALQAAYCLTPTEARLARALAKGACLEEAAEEMNITPSTARTHLKHIFSKTETSRQAELVALLLTGPGRLRQLYQGHS